MDAERWKRIEEVYYGVQACPLRRGAILNELCPDDPDIRQEVESLLDARERAGNFLSSDDFSEYIAELASDPNLSGCNVGPYEILDEIGSGAMGVVYRARDTRLGRQVALKVLPAGVTQNVASVARFRAEARAASALNHPNIVAIYEIGEDSGLSFIVTELIEGVTLRERLRDGKLSLEDTLSIALQCAAALGAAHRAGIVHRDIKPENIMVRPDGVVKVVDFGLARMIKPAPDKSLHATQTGHIMGTPRYMSPEQARGRKPDVRSDIFSLGAVLFELAAGHPAFPGTTTAEVFAALLDSAPDVAGAGPLKPVISKALAKDTAARYQTMEEFARDLRNIDMDAQRPVIAQRLRAVLAPIFHFRNWHAIALLPVLALVGYMWFAHREVPGNANLKFKSLTTFGGSKQYPAFSADGSRIAFSWRASVQQTHHIYVKPVANGRPVQLTFGSEEDASPTWSPDGRQIAFCRSALSADERPSVPSGVYVVPALGGTDREVGENCEGVSWSPDGKMLAVARAPNNATDSGGIDLLFLKTGERRRLTRSRQDMLPAYSPNGKWLAFVRVLPGRGRGREIFVVSAMGGQPRRLTFDSEYINGVTWSSDSREIVFSSPRAPTQGAVWRIPVSGGTPRPLSAALRNASFPSISWHGRRMAFIDSWSDSNLYLRAGPGPPRAGMPWEFDAPLGVALSTRTDHSPVFSPDGERFAYISDRTGSNQVWISRRDGSHSMQLTALGRQSASSPRWSPNGARIAFDVWAAHESNIYVVSSHGGEPRRVSLDPGQGWKPAWSSDGQWIYFTSSRSGASEIWKVPAGGGEAIQVTHTGAYAALPSPGGKIIYFRKSTPAGCCAIWSVPVRGGGEEPVRELEKFTRISRSWGVIKDGIYFLARQHGPQQTVRFLSFATHKVSDVVRLEKEPDWSFLGLAMSPGGRYLLTVQLDREANDLMMIENFR